MKTAADLMRKNVITIRPDATVPDLAQLLDDEGIHGVPVVDSAGNPIGVVSRSDIVRSLNESEPAKRPSEHYYAVGEDEIEWSEEGDGTGMPDSLDAGVKVSEIMSAKLVTTKLTATAGELARSMLRSDVRRLLVLDGRRLAGIVSMTDLLRALVDYEKALTVRKPKARRPAGKVRAKAKKVRKRG